MRVIAALLALQLVGALQLPCHTCRPSRTSRSTAIVAQCRCPLTGQDKATAPRDPSSPDTAPPPPPPIEALAMSLEQSAQRALGVERPLGAVAAESAIRTLLTGICDELMTLRVQVSASSSWQMLTLPQKPGSIDSASIGATGVSVGGLRVSSCDLSFPEGISADFGSPFSNPPTLPNLAKTAEATFSVRLSQDDLTRSPILFASLEVLLRELIRTGASEAIGRVLPAESLRITLQSIESIRDGRVTLVAVGSTTAEDGSNLTLEGLRVRTRVRVNRVERLIVLQSPELVSTFEGFGARLEVGLPFLRGAGIPLPEGLNIASLEVEDGAISATGTLELRPIDYATILAEVQAFQEAAERRAPTATTVDAEAVADDEPPSAPPPGAFPPRSV